MAAIFNNSRWLPLMRYNMTTNAPRHLYWKLKFSKLSEFSDVRNSPPTLHVNYRAREPHVSHTGINVCVHCPLHLPKKVTEKPSVNHIGSSTSHQQIIKKFCIKIFWEMKEKVHFLWCYTLLSSLRKLHCLPIVHRDIWHPEIISSYSQWLNTIVFTGIPW